MTAFALTLILIAAFLHAAWNLFAKRAGGGLPWVWLVGAIICVLYIPVILVYARWREVTLPAGAVWWIFGSGVLKTGYSLYLQRAYRSGDFSLIYPLARGTGPLLAMIAAILLLGERPSALAIAGGLAIVAAVFFLTGGFEKVGVLILSRPRHVLDPTRAIADNRPYLRSIGYGVMTGVFIAAYTLWDKHGVSGLIIAPILYDAGTAYTQLVLLTPFAVRRWPEVTRHWREHRGYAIGMAVLAPIAYVLVLTALSFTPVSYIAPAREVSIVIGAFIGARYLKELHGRRRITAAVIMTAGVIALALG